MNAPERPLDAWAAVVAEADRPHNWQLLDDVLRAQRHVLELTGNADIGQAMQYDRRPVDELCAALLAAYTDLRAGRRTT